MNATMSLALPIALPILVGVLVLPFLRKQASFLAWASLGAVVVTLLASLGLLSEASASSSIPWLGFFDLSFGITGFKALLLGFLFFFQILNGIYLLQHTARVPRPWLFTTFSLVAFGSACGAVLAQNVMILLIGWQLMLVSLYAMVLAGGDGTDELAKKTLVLNGAGDFLMILGLMLYHSMEAHLDLNTASHVAVGTSFATFASFTLMFLGAGAKIGLFPFHSWMPEAAEKMPAPGFALLPATLNKVVGVYFLYVICNELFLLNPAARRVMFVFAVLTIFAGLIPALVERHFRKALAYLSIAPAGFMIAGLATSAAAGTAGALMFLLAHVACLSGMVYAASNLEQAAGGATLEAIEARREALPLTVLGFLLCFTAMVALPPTAGYLGAWHLFAGLFSSHHFIVYFLVWLGLALTIAVALKLAAVVVSGWKGKAKTDLAWPLMLPALVLGFTAFLGGLVLDLNADLIGGVAGATGSDWLHEAWSFAPVTIAVLGAWIFGAALFFALRKTPAWSTFAFLKESPVLGRGYEKSDEKTFDAYEIGMKAIQWLANVVFRGIDRVIDKVGDWFIGTGRAFARPALSAIHNGVYSNYLAWVVAGFVLVSALILLR